VLQLDAVERMDGETGGLYQRQADQQGQQGAGGEAGGPETGERAQGGQSRSISAAST
jgi:hypothetical protein